MATARSGAPLLFTAATVDRRAAGSLIGPLTLSGAFGLKEDMDIGRLSVGPEPLVLKAGSRGDEFANFTGSNEIAVSFVARLNFIGSFADASAFLTAAFLLSSPAIVSSVVLLDTGVVGGGGGGGSRGLDR